MRGRRVLDVGCGTGTLAAALAEHAHARVWAVDPEPRMLEVARAKTTAVRFKEARAEQLPFKDGWFERVTTTLVLHLLDRPRAFAEFHRALGPEGRFAAVTFDPRYFRSTWLTQLFPSIEHLDVARFPARADLEAELEKAGFVSVRFLCYSWEVSFPREHALERIRGRHISTFDLISDDEYHSGLERAERDLPEQMNERIDQLIVIADA